MNWLALTRAAFGLTVLLRPDEVAGHIGDRELSSGTRDVMRILGARLLFEAAVCAVRPTRALVACEAAVDVIHGTTMAAVAALTDNDSRRRAAAANVATAAAFIAADVMTVRRGGYALRITPDANPVLRLRNAVADRVSGLLPAPIRP